MFANLGTNIREALKIFYARSVTGWTDSTVVLHWLKKKGNYKVFAANSVEKELTE